MSSDMSLQNLRLLDSEKSQTVFSQKRLSNEQNDLRSKFKDKIERQNWNIKDQVNRDELHSNHSRLSFTQNLDGGATSRPQSTTSRTSDTHFNLGYQRDPNVYQRTKETLDRDHYTNISLQYLRQNNEMNLKNPSKKSNVVFGSDQKSLA